MFKLEDQIRGPKNVLIADKIKDLIMSKVIRKDQRLPSIRTLSREIRVNPNTVQKAYRNLENKGICIL